MAGAPHLSWGAPASAGGQGPGSMPTAAAVPTPPGTVAPRPYLYHHAPGVAAAGLVPPGSPIRSSEPRSDHGSVGSPRPHAPPTPPAYGGAVAPFGMAAGAMPRLAAPPVARTPPPRGIGSPLRYGPLGAFPSPGGAGATGGADGPPRVVNIVPSAAVSAVAPPPGSPAPGAAPSAGGGASSPAPFPRAQPGPTPPRVRAISSEAVAAADALPRPGAQSGANRTANRGPMVASPAAPAAPAHTAGVAASAMAQRAVGSKPNLGVVTGAPHVVSGPPGSPATPPVSWDGSRGFSTGPLPATPMAGDPVMPAASYSPGTPPSSLSPADTPGRGSAFGGSAGTIGAGAGTSAGAGAGAGAGASAGAGAPTSTGAGGKYMRMSAAAAGGGAAASASASASASAAAVSTPSKTTATGGWSHGSDAVMAPAMSPPFASAVGALTGTSDGAGTSARPTVDLAAAAAATDGGDGGEGMTEAEQACLSPTGVLPKRPSFAWKAGEGATAAALAASHDSSGGDGGAKTLATARSFGSKSSGSSGEMSRKGSGGKYGSQRSLSRRSTGSFYRRNTGTSHAHPSRIAGHAKRSGRSSPDSGGKSPSQEGGAAAAAASGRAPSPAGGSAGAAAAAGSAGAAPMYVSAGAAGSPGGTDIKLTLMVDKVRDAEVATVAGLDGRPNDDVVQAVIRRLTRMGFHKASASTVDVMPDVRVGVCVDWLAPRFAQQGVTLSRDDWRVVGPSGDVLPQELTVAQCGLTDGDVVRLEPVIRSVVEKLVPTFGASPSGRELIARLMGNKGERGAGGGGGGAGDVAADGAGGGDVVGDLDEVTRRIMMRSRGNGHHGHAAHSGGAAVRHRVHGYGAGAAADMAAAAVATPPPTAPHAAYDEGGDALSPLGVAPHSKSHGSHEGSRGRMDQLRRADSHLTVTEDDEHVAHVVADHELDFHVGHGPFAGVAFGSPDGTGAGASAGAGAGVGLEAAVRTPAYHQAGSASDHDMYARFRRVASSGSLTGSGNRLLHGTERSPRATSVSEFDDVEGGPPASGGASPVHGSSGSPRSGSGKKVKRTVSMEQMYNAEGGRSHSVLAADLLRPIADVRVDDAGKQDFSWIRCYVLKDKKGAFHMYADTSKLFIMSALKVHRRHTHVHDEGDADDVQYEDAFYLSQHESFPTTFVPSKPLSEQSTAGRYVGVLARAPGAGKHRPYSLRILSCENCDNRIGKYMCRLKGDGVKPRQVLLEVSQANKIIRPRARPDERVAVHSATVVMPRVHADLSRAVWCPRNLRGADTTGRSLGLNEIVTRHPTRRDDASDDAGSASSSTGLGGVDALGGMEVPTSKEGRDDEIVLHSEHPRWSNSKGALTMVFVSDRIVASSSKNFLLTIKNDRGKKVPVLEFGKMDHGRFALDFRHPICPIQAFGVFLSAFGWYPADD